MTHPAPPRNTPTITASLKKYSVEDRGILERRVKANPRYTTVQARTNTGFNTHRRQELDREIRKYYKVRNDEEFRRISLGDLIQLMVTYAFDSAAAEEEEEEECQKEEEEEERGEISHRFPLKYQNEMKNVIHGMEDLMTEGRKSPPPKPYLIIDIRPPNDYTTGHIITATNHPAPRLSRAVGWESGPLLTYKNRPGTVIVICDEGEESSASAIGILQHRGYTNVMLLSGGVKLARDKIGVPFITTTTDDAVSLQEAVSLQSKLVATNLPPLSVVDGPRWWAAGNTARATQRSGEAVAARPKPWR